MKVDQSLYGVTKERLVSKEKSFLYTEKHKEPDNHKEHPDPFLSPIPRSSPVKVKQSFSVSELTRSWQEIENHLIS